MDDSCRGFRASKVFEGNGPLVIWSVLVPLGAGQGAVKLHLVADARQKTFGLRLEKERSDDVLPGGSVVTLMRKHVRTSGIGRILRDKSNGHFWIPLHTSREEAPDFWLMLAQGLPPELRFVGKDGVALVRKSSQGTYTKRRLVEEALPSGKISPTGESSRQESSDFVDITPELLALARDLAADDQQDIAAERAETAAVSIDTAGYRSERQETAGQATPSCTFATGQDAKTEFYQAEASIPSERQSQATSPFPEYQRDARQRLSRRLKTVRKAQEKLRAQMTQASQAQSLLVTANLLQTWLHKVKPEAFELILAPEETGREEALRIPLDPDLSPGENLAKLYETAKKAKRAEQALSEQERKSQAERQGLEGDLSRLKTSVLPLTEVQAMLRRFRLPLAKQAAPEASGEGKLGLPYKSFLWKNPPKRDGSRDDSHGLASEPQTVGRIWVGRSAADSDDLCRHYAKANDYWFHIVGTTGSHIIVPHRFIKGDLPEGLVRAAAILAIHFSKGRDRQGGEVYKSRRQHIKKRKGMAPGLWQIEKAETLQVQFTANELQELLANMEG